MAEKNAVVWVIGILVVAIFASKAGLFDGSNGAGTGTSTQTSQTGSGTIINTVNPAIQVAGVDKQQTGTTVTSNPAKASTGGGAFATITLGTTTTVPGQTLDLFLTNGTSYHTAYYGKDIQGDANVQQSTSSISVTPSTFPITVVYNKNATVTENIFNTLGVAITNGGGATNQTNNGNGASYTLKDSMSGTSLQSTQDMKCIVELTAGVNASTTPAGVTLSLNGNSIPVVSTSIPAWYTPVGTNSRVWIFDVAPLSSAAQVDYSLGLNALSTGSFTAGNRAIKTCYTKEYFIDPNSGQVTYDVADSNNVVQSIAKYAYTVYFQ